MLTGLTVAISADVASTTLGTPNVATPPPGVWASARCWAAKAKQAAAIRHGPKNRLMGGPNDKELTRVALYHMSWKLPVRSASVLGKKMLNLTAMLWFLFVGLHRPMKITISSGISCQFNPNLLKQDEFSELTSTFTLNSSFRSV